MNKTLTAIVAAAALGGCAKEVPVVEPAPLPVYEHRDALDMQLDPETGEMASISYLNIRSDAASLKLTYISYTNGEMDNSLSLERQEENGVCTMERVQYICLCEPPYNFVLEDAYCDGIVDAAYNVEENWSASRNSFPDPEGVDAGFAKLRLTIDHLFDIEYQLEQRHERNNQKGGN